MLKEGKWGERGIVVLSRPWVYGVNPPFPSFHPVSLSYMFGSLDVVSIWNKLFDDEDRWIVMLWMMIFLSHLTIRVEFRGFPTLFMHIRTFIYQIKVYNGLSTVLFALFKLPTLFLGELAVWSDLTDYCKIFFTASSLHVSQLPNKRKQISPRSLCVNFLYNL